VNALMAQSGLLAAPLAQHLAHGAANNAGHVVAQVAQAFFDPVETALDFVEATIDLIKSLLCLSLEAEQVPVDAFDLLGKKFGRAFELAYTALEIANLRLDFHGHTAPVITNDCGLRADVRSAKPEASASSLRR
jgi:hypothetical protein